MVRSAALAGVVMTAVVLVSSPLRGANAGVASVFQRDNAPTAHATPFEHAAALKLPSGDAGATRRIVPRGSVPLPAAAHARIVRHPTYVHPGLSHDTPPREVVHTRGYQSTAPPRSQS